MNKKTLIIIGVILVILVTAGSLYVLGMIPGFKPTNQVKTTYKLPPSKSGVGYKTIYPVNQNIQAKIVASSSNPDYNLTLQNQERLITVLNERGLFVDGKQKQYVVKVELATIKGTPDPNLKTIVLSKPVEITPNGYNFSFYVTPAMLAESNVNEEFLSNFLHTAFSLTMYSDALLDTEVKSALDYLGNDPYFEITQK